MVLVVLLAVLPLLRAATPDLSSCCTTVRLESSGPAAEHQTNRLQEFSLSGLLGDRPLYTSTDGTEFLFYLRSKNKVGRTCKIAVRGFSNISTPPVMTMYYAMCCRVCGWLGQRWDSSTAGWRTGGTRSVLTTYN